MREKTVSRGGFPRNDDGSHVCADGMCIMSALIMDLNPDVHRDTHVGDTPGSETVARALHKAGILFHFEEYTFKESEGRFFYDPQTQQAINEIALMIGRNDTGQFATEEAVRAALYLPTKKED